MVRIGTTAPSTTDGRRMRRVTGSQRVAMPFRMGGHGFTRKGSAKTMPYPMSGLWSTVEGALHSSRPAVRSLARAEREALTDTLVEMDGVR